MKITIILIAAGLILIGVYLKKKGLFKDNNNNYIPDFADKMAKNTSDKINEALHEAEDRIAAVVEESKDVTKAIKKAGKQLKDIPKAAAGKKRPGRKANK